MSDAPYPDWLLAQVQAIAPHLSGHYAAQLLWQRGLRDQATIAGFLQPEQYCPTGPEAFGEEMDWAIARLEQARTQGERVTIWGDFDADGVTATSVLWEGLGQFFSEAQLNYVIPNRLTDSHGLNCHGIQSLHEQGTTLIITCDTGCTNLTEIELANQLGIDVIVTDHHTLPDTRPPVVAMINPRQLADDHPLATLSGVAVAYKVVEAWYRACPDIPHQPLEELLDLVAIGLIADLVALKRDCRYLAQKGLQKLKTRLQNESSRPGVAKLLSLCKKAGDRPTDISFGIGPRINAVSRIHGDASFCVELLTSRDAQRCGVLAIETELANSRRKELQQRIKKEAIAEIEKLDLSTTQVIVIAKRQWPLGVLGLVAGELAQAWQRPVILMQIETNESGTDIARGSARSVRGIDLYDLMAAQSHLLIKFGGHPFAAGLSLSADKIELLTQSLNHALRLRPPTLPETQPYDLIVTVQELGQSLFKELQLLEPYGMGNRVPKLLIKHCWFEETSHRNLRDRSGKPLKYIQARFKLRDDSSAQGFPGVWWEHYKEDLPKGRCDLVAELDFNNYQRQPEIRMLELVQAEALESEYQEDGIQIFDFRQGAPSELPENGLVIHHCPQSWDEWGRWVQRSRLTEQPLVLTYPTRDAPDSVTTWQQLVGITKAAMKSGEPVLRSRLAAALQLSEETVNQGLIVLQNFGVTIKVGESGPLRFSGQFSTSESLRETVELLLARIDEERFQQRYFAQISPRRIQAIAVQTSGTSIK